MDSFEHDKSFEHDSLFCNFMKLPTELQNIIIDYYYDLKHTEKMALIQKELPEKSYRINRCFTMNLSLRNHDFRVFHTNHTELYIEECIRAITYLSSCQCCKRHQEKRPNHKYILEKKKLDYPFRDVDYAELQCHCNCRHLSRWVARGHTQHYRPILVSLRNVP